METTTETTMGYDLWKTTEPSHPWDRPDADEPDPFLDADIDDHAPPPGDDEWTEEDAQRHDAWMSHNGWVNL